MGFSELADGALRTMTSVMGEDVSYRPAAGGEVALRGIWADVYEAIEPDTGARITETQPNVGIRLADLAAEPAVGDELDVLGKSYEVVEVQQDGQGAARLLLHER